MSRGRGGSERGSVAITVALAMTVLLGFAALVVDVGLSWAARTSAQSAADSAALAGATRLLADGPAAAVLSVRDYLNANVPGLVAPPDDLAWVDNGDESDGEIVCWTLPVEPTVTGAMNVLGLGGGVEVTGGGIAVNSANPVALVLSAGGDVSADQIRVIGGFPPPTGAGEFIPTPELGGPPVADPLAGLRTPDQLTPPPTPQVPPTLTGTVNLPPGVYPSITVDDGVTVTLEDGVYVFTEPAGLTIRNGGRVVTRGGDRAAIYLACEDYPTRCSGNGARFLMEPGGQFQVDPPAAGEYAGLSIFADRGNTTPMLLLDDVSLGGALYGPSTPLVLSSAGDVQVDSLLVIGTLRVSNTDLGVAYDPSVP